MDSTELIFIARFAAPALCGVAASVIDLRERRIPNLLSVSLLAVGLVFRGISGGWEGLADSLEGAAAGFALLFLLWIIGGGGGGDVKFMTAVGAWLGWYHLLWVFVLSAVLLVIFSLLNILLRLVTGRMPRPSDNLLKHGQGKNPKERKKPPRGTVPYALPATAAVCLRLVWMIAVGNYT